MDAKKLEYLLRAADEFDEHLDGGEAEGLAALMAELEGGGGESPSLEPERQEPRDGPPPEDGLCPVCGQPLSEGDHAHGEP